MTKSMDAEEYVTLADAAQALSTTETRILMLLKQKALQGTPCEGGWLIARASLDSPNARRVEAERQLSCRSSCSSSTCGCRG